MFATHAEVIRSTARPQSRVAIPPGAWLLPALMAATGFWGWVAFALIG